MRGIAIPAILMSSALVGLSLVLGGEADQKRSEPTIVTIAKETTRITKPLRKDGYPDYVAALDELTGNGVTAENNVAVVLFQELGPGEVGEGFRNEYFRQLGIKPVPKDGEYLIEFRDFLEQKGIEPEQVSKIDGAYDNVLESRAPWSAEDIPLLAEWLAKYEQQLNRIVEGSKRPRYYSPMRIGDKPQLLIAVLLPSLTHFRTACRPLQARAMLRLGEGNIEEAWSDLMACHRLARLVDQGPFLVDVLVSSYVEGQACRGVAGLAHHGKLSVDQVKNFRAQLDALPKVPRVADVLDQGERYFFLDVACAAARDGLQALSDDVIMGDGNGQSGWESTLKILSQHAVDWDVVLKMGNKSYDRIVRVARIKEPAKRAQELIRLEEATIAMSRKAKKGLLGSPLLLLAGEQGKRKISEVVSGMLISLLVPAVTSIVHSEHQNLTLIRLEKMSLELAEYRARHGNYPDRLEDLAPGQQRAIPLDDLSGAPFRYRRDGDDYVLYSIGANGEDDNGLQFGEDDEKWKADDIALKTKHATE